MSTYNDPYDPVNSVLTVSDHWVPDLLIWRDEHNGEQSFALRDHPLGVTAAFLHLWYWLDQGYPCSREQTAGGDAIVVYGVPDPSNPYGRVH